MLDTVDIRLCLEYFMIYNKKNCYLCTVMRHYIITLLFALIMASCGDDEPEAVTKVSRTVLVYIAGNNSLGSGWDEKDISEMESAVAAGALNGGRLLVYHADIKGNPVLCEITEDGGLEAIKEYKSGLSSVSIAAMKEVFADMHDIAPADDYGLVLWSHASGWIDYGRTPEHKVSKSWGIDGTYQMTIPDLGRALQGEEFSFIYFDCCFMGNIESLYEIRDAAPYIVASPAETPLDGMPYDMNVKCFFEKTPDLVKAAKNTFDSYDALSGRSRSSTMAVYDMRYIGEVASAVREIMLHNAHPSEWYEQQQYGTSGFRDLFFDLTHYVRSLTSDSSMLADYDAAMARFVIYNENTPQMALSLPAIDLNNCHGVSCYIVETEGDSVVLPGNYGDLQWWGDVVSPAFGF